MKTRISETIACPHCGVGGFHYKGYYEDIDNYEEAVWGRCPNCQRDIIAKINIDTKFEVVSRTSRFNSDCGN